MSQQPLRILLTDPHSDGGGQVRYLQSLAGELVRLGHDVTIGCRAGSVLADVAREVGCAAIDRFYFPRGFRPRYWTADIQRMRALVGASPPDVVHVSGSQDHWVAGLTKALYAPRLCLVRTRHNTYPVKTGVANRLLNRRWTTHQITVCEMVRQTLMAHPAFDSSRLTSIHNGVDIEKYRPNPEARARIRQEFDYGDRDWVCGIAARLVEAKGHTYLFQAAAEIRDRVPGLRILVLGQGKLEAALRAEVAQRGLDDLVRFAGYRNDMEACIQALDVGVLPSIDCDTSSFSLKEQMAAGLPVITSDYGGLPEIVSNGVEGLVVPNGTVAPLAEALVQLEGNRERGRHLGARGRERVAREFSLQAFAARTVDVYRTAMDEAHEHTAH